MTFSSVAQSAGPFVEWREAESKGLVKVMWEEGVVLCNTCYMNFVENPLIRGSKQVKVTNEEEET